MRKVLSLFFCGLLSSAVAATAINADLNGLISFSDAVLMGRVMTVEDSPEQPTVRLAVLGPICVILKGEYLQQDVNEIEISFSLWSDESPSLKQGDLVIAFVRRVPDSKYLEFAFGSGSAVHIYQKLAYTFDVGGEPGEQPTREFLLRINPKLSTTGIGVLKGSGCRAFLDAQWNQQGGLISADQEVHTH